MTILSQFNSVIIKHNFLLTCFKGDKKDGHYIESINSLKDYNRKSKQPVSDMITGLLAASMYGKNMIAAAQLTVS